jgi:hypothetical protein
VQALEVRLAENLDSRRLGRVHRRSSMLLWVSNAAPAKSPTPGGRRQRHPRHLADAARKPSTARYQMQLRDFEGGSAVPPDAVHPRPYSSSSMLVTFTP